MTGAVHWQGRTILVTGAAGYVGSQVMRDLGTNPRFSGATIRGLDNMQRGTFTALMDLPPRADYEFVEADLLDTASLRRALSGVDAVVHLAALVQTPFSFDNPRWTEHVNHWGTAQLVEQCLENGIDRFIFASSTSVYGAGGPFNESAECHPIGPYSQSKLRAEEAVRAATARGLTPTILRLGTVFGYAPAIRFDAVPNRFAYLAAIRRPVTIHGDGAQMRALVHVADAAAAILFCLDKQLVTASDTLNCTSVNATILQIAQTLNQVCPTAEVRRTDQHALAQFSLSASAERLASLGFKPRLSLLTGFKEMLARLGLFSPAAVRALQAVE